MTFRFSVTVDGVVFVPFEVLDVGLVDLGVMVLELDSFFWSRFFSELGAEEWASGGMVIMVDVTGGLWGYRCHVFSEVTELHVLNKSTMTLILKISSITSVMLEDF